MATASARQISIVDSYAAPSRVDAVESILNGTAISASHDMQVNAYVLNAVERLLQHEKDGRLSLNIEGAGFPEDVLLHINEQFEKLGVSHSIGNQLITALQEYIVSTGSDFSRAANARPLYARIMITSQKPDNMPDLELFQAGSINGRRKLGSEATQVVRQMTIYGSTTTSTKGMNMPGLFESKEPELFYCFGTLGEDALKDISAKNTITTAQNAAMLNTVQALTGVASPSAIREIQDSIKAGTISPAATTLISNMAELRQSNVSDAQQPTKIAALSEKIIATLQEGVQGGTLSKSLIDASIAAIRPQSDTISSVAAEINQAAPVANNDNVTIESQATKISMDLHSVAQEIVRAAMFTPMPAVVDLQTKIEALTPAKIEQVLAGTADAQTKSDFQEITKIISEATATPQAQAIVSIEAKSILSSIEATAQIVALMPAATAVVNSTQSASAPAQTTSGTAQTASHNIDAAIAKPAGAMIAPIVDSIVNKSPTTAATPITPVQASAALSQSPQAPKQDSVEIKVSTVQTTNAPETAAAASSPVQNTPMPTSAASAPQTANILPSATMATAANSVVMAKVESTVSPTRAFSTANPVTKQEARFDPTTKDFFARPIVQASNDDARPSLIRTVNLQPLNSALPPTPSPSPSAGPTNLQPATPALAPTPSASSGLTNLRPANPAPAPTPAKNLQPTNPVPSPTSRPTNLQPANPAAAPTKSLQTTAPAVPAGRIPDNQTEKKQAPEAKKRPAPEVQKREIPDMKKSELSETFKKNCCPEKPCEKNGVCPMAQNAVDALKLQM